MTEYAVLDRFGNRWDVVTSKTAAETARKALNARQKPFGPFTVEPTTEEQR